jgi:hypothetical protein
LKLGKGSFRGRRQKEVLLMVVGGHGQSAVRPTHCYYGLKWEKQQVEKTENGMELRGM